MDYDAQRDIGGYTYRVTRLRFRQARPIAAELSRDFAAVIRAAGDKADGVAMADIDISAVTSGLATLIERIDDDRLNRYAEVLGKMSAVQSDDGNWPPLTLQFQDTHFAGAPMRFMQWLTFALEVNNADFFDVCRSRLGPGLGELVAKAESAFNTPSGSTERSSDSPTHTESGPTSS